MGNITRVHEIYGNGWAFKMLCVFTEKCCAVIGLILNHMHECVSCVL